MSQINWNNPGGGGGGGGGTSIGGRTRCSSGGKTVKRVSKQVWARNAKRLSKSQKQIGGKGIQIAMIIIWDVKLACVTYFGCLLAQWRIQGGATGARPVKLDQLFVSNFVIRMLKNKAQKARDSINTTLELPGPLSGPWTPAKSGSALAYHNILV